MPDLYWEDFTPGTQFDLGAATVSEQELLDFARKFDPQPIHTDAQAAQQGMYGGLIASGWHTCALVMRTLVDQVLSRAASLASPGIDHIRWLKPVRPGDTLRTRLTVLEARPSSSKPDRGLVRSRWEVQNQHGELVMTMEGMTMYRRRAT